MTDWNAKAHAAIRHIEARKRKFPATQILGLIDALAEKAVATSEDLQAHGSADFVLTALAHVTTAVHGGGRVPREGGWYNHPRKGAPYTIHPGFAAAWTAARSL